MTEEEAFEPAYIWTDIETTGLIPKGDYILEIAAVITDKDLRRIGKPFQSLVWNGLHEDGRPNHIVRLEANEFVRNMHTKNGLLAEFDALHEVYCYGTPGEVELGLLDWLPKDGKPRSLRIAGASIHFDRGFLYEHMPTLAAFFSHQHYDVSAQKLLFGDAIGMTFPKAEAHRALDDVFESLEQARRMQRVLRRILNDAIAISDERDPSKCLEQLLT